MPVLIRHLWQLKSIVFLHWCLIRAILLTKHQQITAVLIFKSFTRLEGKPGISCLFFTLSHFTTQLQWFPTIKLHSCIKCHKLPL